MNVSRRTAMLIRQEADMCLFVQRELARLDGVLPGPVHQDRRHLIEMGDSASRRAFRLAELAAAA